MSPIAKPNDIIAAEFKTILRWVNQEEFIALFGFTLYLLVLVMIPTFEWSFKKEKKDKDKRTKRKAANLEDIELPASSHGLGGMRAWGE